jgi:hypothetical protein
MTRRAIDLTGVRRELRALPRGRLLLIAERTAELISNAKLETLLADFFAINEIETASLAPASLLDEVRTFHSASLGGQFHEELPIHFNNTTDRSTGSDAFIAEFDRLIRHCIRAAKTAPLLAVREAFELLFDVLRHIDKGNDDIIFFADEGGSGEVGVDWRSVFPVYFRCVAKSASAHVFVQVVDQVIRDFADFERPTHLQVARRVANTDQKAAMDVLHRMRK